VVYIHKVYTKFGDAGDTMLASGDTVRKDSARVAAYGDVDELNSVIGLLRLEIGRTTPIGEAARFLAELDQALAVIQQDLFDLGAELATRPTAESPVPRLHVEDTDVTRLARTLDAWNDPLPPLRSFILPGGGPVGVAAHLARTVCRRAERHTVALAAQEPVRPEALRYLNRLSDLLFVIARAAAHHQGVPEVLWDARRRIPADPP
jgi:cob(I)alamin adenosyltransferase